MGSPYRDLDRPPLVERALRAALVVEGGLWTSLSVVERTGSTNADLAAAARRGAAQGTVLVAEHQSAGRGRLDRLWSAPPRSGLTFSMLLRPPLPRERWSWLPLLAGVAVAVPVARLSGLSVRLKWPNDVLVADRKLAGILAEVVEDAVVVGVGLNVSLRAAEAPVPTATSLVAEESEVVDRGPVLRAVLREMAARYQAFCTAGGDADATGLRRDYLAACATVGKRVRVSLPAGEVVEGEAYDVDGSARLLVRTAAGPRVVSAGDVVHLRPTPHAGQNGRS